MWIDIGVKNRAEALERVRVGTTGVIDSVLHEFPNGRIVSRSIDNRIGAYTVLEALRLLSSERPVATVAAAAPVQEEITHAGGHTTTYRFEPQAAIIVDVTHATDFPNSDKKLRGEAKLGGGPALARGSVNSPVVVDLLVEAAARENIPYTMKAHPDRSATDADVMHYSRLGVACAVVSIPNRYMHTPNEMIQLSDVQHAARLIAAFARLLTPGMDFTPR
jgi:endoglucanase